MVQKYRYKTTLMMLPGGLSAVKTGEGECTKGEQTASTQGVSVY